MKKPSQRMLVCGLATPERLKDKNFNETECAWCDVAIVYSKREEADPKVDLFVCVACAMENIGGFDHMMRVIEQMERPN